MSDFEGPGEGWRELNAGTPTPSNVKVVVLVDEMGAERRWVPEPPVPPLPAEPYTVIRVTWKNGGTADYMATERGTWLSRDFESGMIWLQGRIAAWEPLARPVGKVLAEDEDAYYDSDDMARAGRETATAVLARIRDLSATTGMPYGDHLERVAKEFGASFNW